MACTIAKCSIMCAKCDPKFHEIIQVCFSKLSFKHIIDMATFKEIINTIIEINVIC